MVNLVLYKIAERIPEHDQDIVVFRPGSVHYEHPTMILHTRAHYTWSKYENGHQTGDIRNYAHTDSREEFEALGYRLEICYEYANVGYLFFPDEYWCSRAEYDQAFDMQ